MNILVTGSTGFLGARLCKTLKKKAKSELLEAVVRRRRVVAEVDSVIQIPCIDSSSDWTDALIAHDVVIHTAARAHIMKDSVADPLTEYRKVNVDGTVKPSPPVSSCRVKTFCLRQLHKGQW